MESLNDKVLRQSREVEIRELDDGTHLCKQLRTGEYLVLKPEEFGILDRFDGSISVQEGFHAALVDDSRPNIRSFYDLVNDATDKGFLFEGDREPTTPTEKGYDFAVQNSELSAFGLPLALIITGASALYVAELPLIPPPVEWLYVLVYVCLGLTLASILSGAALAAYGRQIYRPRLRMDYCLPFFEIDTRDALMGGRPCETATALSALAGPFCLVMMGWAMTSTPLFLAGWVTALILAAPFGNSPGHSLLHALFRKEHKVPRNADKFMQNKAFTQIFNFKEQLAEEKYFIAHSTYAVLWLGAVFRFASRMLKEQAEDLLVTPGAPTMVFLLTLVVAAPIVYVVWTALRNVYRALAPKLTAVESRLKSGAAADKPSTRELAAFLEKCILFAELDDPELEALANSFSYVPVKANTLVIRERDRGDLFFVIYQGEVEVLKDDDAGEAESVAKLGPTDVFGEIALLQEVPRTSSVRTLTDCKFLTLNKKDFEGLLVGTMGAKKIQQLVQVCAFLRRNPLFSGWPSRALIKIASEFTFEECEAGVEMIEEGKENEFFYLIYEGEFDVSKDGKNIAQLGPGDFCGEISLLRGVPANARVSVAKSGRALRLGKDGFLQMVSQDFVLALELDRQIDKRVKELKARKMS